MHSLNICPRCKSDIPQERLNQTIVVCSACGWTNDNSFQQLQKSMNKRFIKVAVVSSIIMVAAFVQLVKWDKYAVQVIPYQVKSFFGSLSAEDVDSLSAICEERKNAACVESLYISLAKRESDNIEHLAKVGIVQYRRQKFNAAAATLKNYFAKGGADFNASYAYAQSLGRIGQIDEAVAYYDQILKAKPETLQVTVAQNYVKLLIENNRRDQALAVLNDIRTLGPNTTFFMDTEFKELGGK